jgi:DNA adenine methylase
MNEKPIPRPFLKWAGGKTQLLNELTQYMPADFGNYHEPFIGSGALFFHVFRKGKIRNAFITDINQELIDTYLAIRDCVEEVINCLWQFPHNRDFYYQLRDQDPLEMDLPLRAARMIYLNKTGYNGLYRVNRDGRFNVPFGRYKSPNYRDEENLRAVSSALQGINIQCGLFEMVLDQAKEGDFVYFDPPYAPLSQTANFTSYHANGFSSSDQNRLRDVCEELTRQNVNVMVSNSDTELIRSAYSSGCFVIHAVRAIRAINSNGARRGRITELIVTNYPREQVTQAPVNV